MNTESLPLVVGLPGTTLGPEERGVLDQARPAGVILFDRNVESADQVRDLMSQLQDLDPLPFVAIDLEGGVVNRLTTIWGTLPSPALAAAAGRRAVRALGEAAGAACRSLGIHLDLAPVVDLERPDGVIAREGRCLSDDPLRVAALAKVFHDGLASWCVGGCLKHFPGLGAIPVDTHQELPVLDLDRAGLQPHLDAFSALSESIPMVMVGHVVVPAFGDSDRPASLSPAVVERAVALPGGPVVVADDLDMGALDEWGDMPDRVLSALRARNHGVLVCKAFDRLAEIADHIRQEMGHDPSLRTRVEEMVARLGTLRRDLCRSTASVPAPDEDTVRQLWERARREASLPAPA